ncbi:MAG: hypothetical protein WC243_02645 [Patescibacteria group bacterium]|jgi:hypothetical protein
MPASSLTRYRKYYVPVILVVFAVLTALGLARHEMWGDELQAWSLSRASKTPMDLYYNLRYEGNSGLWHMILFFVSRITRDVIAIKILNFIFILAAVFVLLRYAKFHIGFKVLIVFGYFFIYEYGVISRHYALTLFLAFLSCALFKDKERHPLFYNFVLALLAFTSPYGTIMSMGFIAATVSERFFKLKKEKLNLGYFVSLGIIVCLLAYVLALPPADGSYKMTRSYFDLKLLKQSVSFVWNSFIPIPSIRTILWNSNFLGNLDAKFFLSIVIVLICAAILFRSKIGLTYFLFVAFCLVLFSYVNFSGALRHQGHIYIAFICAIWLGHESVFGGVNKSLSFLRGTFLLLLFAGQIYAGAKLWLTDYSRVFYYASAAGDFIKESNLSSYYLIGDSDVGPMDVAMYLDKPMLVSKLNKKQLFVVYDNKRKSTDPSEERLFTRAWERYEDGNKDILLLTTYPIHTSTNPAELLVSFNDSMAVKRGLFIYKYLVN